MVLLNPGSPDTSRERASDVNFCRTFISSISLFLEVPGSNLVDTAQPFQSHMASFIFVKCVCCLCKCENVAFRIESFS